MSDYISPLVACPALQARLVDLYENLNPTEPTPLTAFLSSDINLRGMKLVPQYAAPGNGKLRKVQLIYTPRKTEDEIADTLTTECVSLTEPAQNAEEYEINPDSGVQVDETFYLRDLATSCQDNEDYIASRVMAMLDGCRRKMETELTSSLSTEIGLFATTDDIGTLVSSDRTVKTVKTAYSDGRLNEDALSQIYYSARQAAFIDKPYIFGTGTIEKYFQALSAPAVTQWGLDLKKYTDNQYVFLPSYRIADAFNQGCKERFIALDANAFFILQYNKFEGMDGLNTLNAQNSGFVQDVIVDPMTGLKFNYKWVYSPCGEKASLFISTAFKLASVPKDMYASTDRLSGVKGSLQFEIGN